MTRLPARLALNLVVALGALLMVAPFVWLLSAITLSSAGIRAGGAFLVPGDQLAHNLSQLFNTTGFGRSLLNSVLISAIFTLLAVAVCSAAGYAFAKFRAWWLSALFGVVIVTLALPGQVTLVPLFKMMVSLGWLNSYQALILPNLALPVGIFLMRQAILSVPDELLDAGRVDGAGEYRIFAQIVLPVVRPSLAALAIFAFLTTWNDFVLPLVVLRDPSSYTVPVEIATMQTVNGTDSISLIMTATAISILPVLGLFLLLQRQFIAGLLGSAVKG
ncbi:carbohydrate ABC transporter permease [Actinoplanes sp. NPDC049596]|uniref:carbohydrate ABC transporter permease n=1 Tax=unclassified Actinoplanes TaxID=2626549 RepID=UPI0034458E14